MPGRPSRSPQSGAGEDHAVFAETAQFFIKQRAAIEKLRADNALLKEEVLLENKFSIQPTSASARHLIEELQEQSDAYTRKITQERQRLLELQEREAALKAKIAGQRTAMGGVNAAQDCDNQLHKQMRTLENRLEKAYHRLNGRQADTRRLRDRIDSLRRERLSFNEQLHKLGALLNVRRDSVAELLKAAHRTGQLRERALGDLKGLKVVAEREQATAEAEWRQLTQLIEADRQQRAAAREKEIADREQHTATVLHDQGATTVRRRTPQSAERSARERSQAQQAADRLAEIDAAFQQIQAATGAKTIDGLVDELAASEDANFRLLGYVGEVNAEVDALEGRIAAIRSEVEQARDAEETQKSQRQRALQEVSERVARSEAKAQAYEARRDKALAVSADLRAKVGAMFERSGCDTPAVREALGPTEAAVTDGNVMQYLGILEQRASEMIQALNVSPETAARASVKGPPRAPTLSGTGTLAAAAAAAAAERPPGAHPTLGELPSSAAHAGDDSDEEEGGVRPLDREALRSRVARSLARKAEARHAPQGGPGHGPTSRRGHTTHRRAVAAA